MKDQDSLMAESQDLADMVCRLADHKPIPLVFRDAHSTGGMAYLTKGYIRISNDELSEPFNEHRLYAVVIHEVCHFLHYQWHKSNGNGYRRGSHDYNFKKIERKWLAQFGMYPIYSRAYFKALLDGDGNVLWQRGLRKPGPTYEEMVAACYEEYEEDDE